GWQSSLLRPLLPASITTRCRPMASTAYPRIGAQCKSEVGVLRLSLRPASSPISIPNSKIQTRRVFRLQTPMERIPIHKHLGFKQQPEGASQVNERKQSNVKQKSVARKFQKGRENRMKSKCYKGTFLKLCVASIGIMVLCAIMPATASAQCPAGNLVVNSGFETNSFVPGWTVAWPPTVDPFTFVDGVPHSGNFAAALGAVPGENSVSQRIFGTLPGRVYTVSFWLQNDDGVPNEFHVQWNGLEILSLHNTNAFPYRQFSLTVIAIGHDTL